MVIDEKKIRNALLQIHEDGELFEVRVLGARTLSGYFDSIDKAVTQLSNWEGSLFNTNIYVTLNELNPALASRMQKDVLVQNAKTTTSDGEVTRYKWLFVDMDPVRPAGISSSDFELEQARLMSDQIETYMHSLGFYKPVHAMSGNGYHLLYRIDMENDDTSKKIVRRCLNVLAQLFNNDYVHVDVSNHNQARICKLYGTLAQKGANTSERPHRMSMLLDNLFVPEVNTIETLINLGKQLPTEPEPIRAKYNSFSPKTFDLESWLSEHGMIYKEQSGTDCRIFRLDECPFDHAHKNGDARIFHYSNGAIAFKCHHNHCSGYKWQDVRTLMEPGAYDTDYSENDERIEAGWKQHNRDKAEKIAYSPIEQETIEEPMWLTMDMIEDEENSPDEYIRTGINKIDALMHGLKKGCLTVVSGLRGSAKSTWLSQVMLQACDDGHSVVCYSGELSGSRFKKWFVLQAAGKNEVENSAKYMGYYVKPDTQEKISEWLKNKFWLYNNKYGNDFMKVATEVKAQIEAINADLCVIDNLMALDLRNVSQDKYEAQTAFVMQLKNIAELSNCHIIFVAHPRKANGFLRLDDISGSGNISNAVDNAFIIHRNNNDFQIKTAEMFKWEKTNPVYNGSNIIEIVKDRDTGIQDEFIPLYFEEKTKRLLNTPEEYIMYGWAKE